MDNHDFELIAVMYHYVRDVRGNPHPGIFAISPADFDRQITKLARRYTIISLHEAAAMLGEPQTASGKYCVLTFDDGFKDHYTNVFPILKNHGLSGAFFPITMTLDGKMVDAHKVHHLLAKVGAEFLVREFNGWLESQPREYERFFINDNEKIDARYILDDVITANLKVTMQLIPDTLRTDFLNRIVPHYLGDEERLARELYLNASEIKEMADYGMIIGSHTHTHSRLDSMEAERSREELEQSKNILEKIIGKTIDCVSYPYGNYGESMIATLSELGYAVGLGTKIGVNDKNANPLFLKRFDEKYLYAPPVSLSVI